MAEQVGSKAQWQRIMRLVADGTVDIAGGTSFGNTIEVLFGQDAAGNLLPDSQPDVAKTVPNVLGHVFYVPSVICRDPTITTYVQGPGLKGVIFDPDSVIASVFRRYNGTTPAQWQAGLQLCNFSSKTVTVLYRVYRFFGLT